VLINRHLIAVFTALIPATVVAQTPNVTACDPGACYAYGQLLKIDRDQAVAAGYAWIAPRDTRPIVMIQTLPTGSALPPVDGVADEAEQHDRADERVAGARRRSGLLCRVLQRFGRTCEARVAVLVSHGEPTLSPTRWREYTVPCEKVHVTEIGSS